MTLAFFIDQIHPCIIMYVALMNSLIYGKYDLRIRNFLNLNSKSFLLFTSAMHKNIFYMCLLWFLFLLEN